jgi:murein L,D-transpeptidase YcbB/YkuD
MYTNRLFGKTTAALLCVCISILISCNGKGQPGNGNIADNPKELQQKAPAIIHELVDKATTGNGFLGDSSLYLQQLRITGILYSEKEYAPFWSFEEHWLPAGDSLFRILEKAQLYGLFPEDYHFTVLNEMYTKFAADSSGKAERKDALLWSKADILLTNAFLQLLKDIKLGRLPQDSVTLRKDSALGDDFYKQQFASLQQGQPLTKILTALEPAHRGYQLLKEGIPAFLAKADYRTFTRVTSKDAAGYNSALQKRLFEGGYIGYSPDSLRADSAQLAQAIKKFQKEKGITVDGKAGEATLRILNTSDREKFIRIAISMDRYKLLPEKMPSKYIWVNTSSNNLEVIDNNEVKLSSKVICGKAKTRTPLLTSYINSIITYPQWVPPPSIVSKEILPAVKKNPGYLARKGFSLVNSQGEEVDPYSVDWSKYSKGIPYRIVQGSGDANALGVIKFVFDNKYSVYLHDTNQRYLFANAMRSLSHGCVRVQSWQDLAWYILRNDSLNMKGGNYTRTDSVKTWLAKKEKRNITIRNKMPVFIRYFTCEGKNNGIIFYDDVYAEDKFLREKYFATK